MTLLEVFDEFPRPLEKDDLSLLRTEVLRLHKAQKTLSGALHYYTKAVDIAKKGIAVIGAKYARELTEVAPADGVVAASNAIGASSASLDALPDQSVSSKRPRESDADAQHGGLIAPAEAASNAEAPQLAPPTAPTGGRRRFVQSAALLAGMKKMMAANQKQAANDGTATLREDRERIAREARQKARDDELSLADAQRTRAESAVSDLQSKLQVIRPRLAMLGVMLDTAEIMEADYCASFYLRAYGAGAGNHDDDDDPCAKAAAAASVDDQQMANDASDDEVYFAPPVHTETTLEMVRLQIYDEILDEYLRFRAQIDPCIAEIRACAAERRAGGGTRRDQVAAAGDTGFALPCSASGATSQPFSPMSAEEASMLLLRAPTATTAATAAGGVEPPVKAAAATAEDAAAPVSWSLYDEAIAALDEFE